MENKKTIEKLLKAHGLKKTTIRTEMLDVFIRNDFALSVNDIIERMKVSNDRVTVYRALISFEKHGILHIASEDRQGVKYALCNLDSFQETDDNQHAHFICDKCHKTYCLKDIVIPEVQVSREFSIDRANYTLRGICKECQD